MPNPTSAPSLPTALDHYRLLGNTGLRVSPLCLGTMTFGDKWGWGADLDESRRQLQLYADRGGNFIDTADMYTHGQSEEFLGTLLHEDAFGGRDRFVLATKYTLQHPATSKGDPNASGNHRKRMMHALEASLKRLQTDYIDLYWTHIWDGTTPVDELMRAFDDMVRQGKVLYTAISDTPAWKIAQLQTYAKDHALTRFACTQVEYSLIERTVEREIAPMCRELGVGLLPWSPLAGGILTGKYTRDDLDHEQKLLESGVDPFNTDKRIVGLTEKKLEIADAVKQAADKVGKTPTQVALNWLLTRDFVTSIIIGARKASQVEDNLGCLDFALPPDVVEQLDRASAIDLGFPYAFMTQNPLVQNVSTGGTRVHGRIQQPPQ